MLAKSYPQTCTLTFQVAYSFLGNFDMALIRRLMLVLAVTVTVFTVAGVMATWAPDQTVAQLQQRWAQPPSVFMKIQGLDVHLRDEGPRNDPTPLILLHGTSDSLHTWQGWADGLKDHHRVIRMDLPAFGSTGPHPHADYSWRPM